MKTKVDDSYIGKYAFKKYGFYSHLIGIIEPCNGVVSKYCIRFKSGVKVGIMYINSIEVVDDPWKL